MRVIEINPSQSPKKDKLYTYADFKGSEFNKDSENTIFNSSFFVLRLVFAFKVNILEFSVAVTPNKLQ